MDRGNRWGREGPPNDAYSRITEPERFMPLHDYAAALLDRLAETFDVDVEEGNGLDPELERGEPVRPTRRLTPSSSTAAPIAIGFTPFPGLLVRFGRWHVGSFPHCGCDACDETFQTESTQLDAMVDALTSGGLSESLRIERGGRSGWLGSRSVHAKGSGGGEGLVEGERLKRLLEKGPAGVIEWEPWPRRRG